MLKLITLTIFLRLMQETRNTTNVMLELQPSTLSIADVARNMFIGKMKKLGKDL